MLHFKNFDHFLELKYGISNKKDGSMRMRLFEDGAVDKAAALNREQFIKNTELANVYEPYLMHGNKVAQIMRNAHSVATKADGFVTSEKNLTLTITVADCFPVYFYDPKKQAIGIAHCGWRGVSKNLSACMIDMFERSFCSRPKDILAGIGPGIQQHHFEVSTHVAEKFFEYKDAIKQRDKKYLINLPQIIRAQLSKSGVTNIQISKVCTYCDTKHSFSARREASHFGVMLAYIILTKNSFQTATAKRKTKEYSRVPIK